jgi:hypothetical protein
MATDDTGKLESITAILVTLRIGEGQSLFIMLDSEGGINRLGTGSVNNSENVMCIGKTDPTLFLQLRAAITPELLQYCGQSLSAPNPKGERCDLRVGFRQRDRRELMTRWTYGSESQGPPPVVGKFVLAAVNATNAWYETQKSL